MDYISLLVAGFNLLTSYFRTYYICSLHSQFSPILMDVTHKFYMSRIWEWSLNLVSGSRVLLYQNIFSAKSKAEHIFLVIMYQTHATHSIQCYNFHEHQDLGVYFVIGYCLAFRKSAHNNFRSKGKSSFYLLWHNLIFEYKYVRRKLWLC